MLSTAAVRDTLRVKSHVLHLKSQVLFHKSLIPKPSYDCQNLANSCLHRSSHSDVLNINPAQQLLVHLMQLMYICQHPDAIILCSAAWPRPRSHQQYNAARKFALLNGMRHSRQQQQVLHLQHSNVAKNASPEFSMAC